MKNKILLLATFGILYGIPAHAQTKFVTLPNGGVVPCDHPLAISAGLSCSNRVTVTDYKCDSYIDPYREPARAAFCSSLDAKPKPSEPFRIGERYYHPYGSKMIVLGIVRDIENREVVLFQVYEGPDKGLIFTLINITSHNLQKVEE